MYFEKNSHYGKHAFWQKRYAENSNQFDWYQNWENLRDIISQFTKTNNKILNVGAGNSPFSEEMYEQGYENIMNLDFSEIVVEDMQMKYKNAEYEETLGYMFADVRNMSQIESQTFDCVIDKGLLDCVLCGAYSKQNSRKMLSEISRVLKTKGYYICISYGNSDIRFNYFDDKNYNWTRVAQCPYKVFKPNISEDEKEMDFQSEKDKTKDFYHYVYIMQKGSEIYQISIESKTTHGIINTSSVTK